MGIKLDKDKNQLAKTRNAETEISAADSKVKVFVIPTDEERVNIEDVIAILEGKYDEHTHFTYRFQSPEYVNSQREQDFVKECEDKPGLKAIQVKPKKRCKGRPLRFGSSSPLAGELTPSVRRTRRQTTRSPALRLAQTRLRFPGKRPSPGSIPAKSPRSCS